MTMTFGGLQEGNVGPIIFEATPHQFFAAPGFLMGTPNILWLSYFGDYRWIGRRSGKQIKAAAMEINGSSIMRTITKTTGHALDLLDLGINRLSKSVGDSMTCISDDVIYMSCENIISQSSELSGERGATYLLSTCYNCQ